MWLTSDRKHLSHISFAQGSFAIPEFFSNVTYMYKKLWKLWFFFQMALPKAMKPSSYLENVRNTGRFPTVLL